MSTVAHPKLSKGQKQRRKKAAEKVQALAQLVSVATRSPARVKPKKRSKKAKSGFTTGRAESGVDVLASITVGTDKQSGSPLMTLVLNPREIKGTRLSQIAEVWARWVPTSLRLEVVSSGSMMTTGSYIAAWNADPTCGWGNLESNVTRLTAMSCTAQVSAGQKMSLQIPTQSSRKWYSVTGDPNDDSHGVVLLALAGRLSAEITLTVKLHWTFRFSSPDLPKTQDGTVMTWPEPDYTPVFTDSVSDWAAGKRLTFKHASGGSVVPWENLQSGVVYEPTEGVRITYRGEKGTYSCRWFSKLNGEATYPSALVCHASKSDAISYQKTGDITKIIEYVGAGDWATPNDPHLVGQPIPQLHEPMVRIGPSLPPPTPTPALTAADLDAIATRVMEMMRQGATSPVPSTSSISAVSLAAAMREMEGAEGVEVVSLATTSP